MLEILKFCPNWLQLPKGAMRAARNGNMSDDLALMFLHPVGLMTAGDFKQAGQRIRKQLSEGRQLYFGHTTNKQVKSKTVQDDMGPHNDLMADAWETRPAYTASGRDASIAHVRLADIYGPVPPGNWPSEYDALIFTKCLDFAAAKPHLNLDTSHLDWLVESQRLTASLHAQATQAQPDTTVGGGDYDAAALRRFRRSVQKPAGW